MAEYVEYKVINLRTGERMFTIASSTREAEKQASFYWFCPEKQVIASIWCGPSMIEVQG